MRITEQANHILIEEAHKGHRWRVPKRNITAIRAAVAERWVVNCRVPIELVNELIPVPWLMPERVDGEVVLSLCAIFMDHAAPLWLPLEYGPGSQNCALRIACRDERNGEKVVWVDQRYTDSPYAPLLELLGYPPMQRGLAVLGSYEHQGLRMRTGDGVIDCVLAEAENDWEGLFPNVEAFEEYFCAGVRSYGPGPDEEHVHVVDLEKLSDNRFAELQDFGGYLAINDEIFPVDSVYRTCGGLYCWHYIGVANRYGTVKEAIQQAA